MNPREIAEKIIQSLPENELIHKTEIAGPGEETTVGVGVIHHLSAFINMMFYYIIRFHQHPPQENICFQTVEQLADKGSTAPPAGRQEEGQ